MEEQEEVQPKENGQNAAPDEEQTGGEQNAPEREKEPREHFTLYKKREKRTGKYVSSLTDKELDSFRLRKALFMYLSTLFFAVSLFLKVEGRAKFADVTALFSLYSLYVICQLVMLFYSVYIMIMGRFGHRIGRELKAKDVPPDGLDKHTFRSYEVFNAFHVVMALAEIAVSVYGFGVWGAVNIVCAAASAVFCFLSRQVLYKANAGRLTYIPEELAEQNKK